MNVDTVILTGAEERKYFNGEDDYTMFSSPMTRAESWPRCLVSGPALLCLRDFGALDYDRNEQTCDETTMTKKQYLALGFIGFFGRA